MKGSGIEKNAFNLLMTRKEMINYMIYYRHLVFAFDYNSLYGDALQFKHAAEIS